MKNQLITRIAIFFAIALAATASACYKVAEPAPTAPASGFGTDAVFSLTLDANDGNRYLMDTGLTLEDCGREMMGREGRGWGCQREDASMPL